MMRVVMLRAFAPTSRSRVVGSLLRTSRTQWAPAYAARAVTRSYADEKKPTDKAVLPGTQSKEGPTFPPTHGISSPAHITPAKESIIAPANVPKVPPPPSSTITQTSPGTSAPPPSSPGPSTTTIEPPPRPRKRRRFRRFLILTTLTLALAYAGGVYYSLTSDAFHDFFTEFIPGGEEAVLFFEEREFKRRYPTGAVSSRMYPQVSGENKVTISGSSGASARPARAADKKSSSTTSGPSKGDDKAGKADRTSSSDSSKTSSSEKSKTPSSKSSSQEPEPKKAEPPSSKKETDTPTPAPAAATPPAPIALISNVGSESASDPAVQKVTTMLNDIITVVNADNASGKYSATLEKAKDDLKQLATEFAKYREVQVAAAEEQIKRNDVEFDKAAKDMLARVQQEQKEQELRWREEYENERARLAQTYDDKIKAELDAAKKVADQKLKNELLEQNLKLQDSFVQTIRQQVETERDARLSKLTELSTAVSELESLTTKWNDVVDANLRTQHLVVAVDAVRTALESADRPTPFLHELAALKETANDNGIVNAAIASIHPTTYQRGVPTSAQLIDRFRHVAEEVRKASLLPENAGVASHAASFVLSKVLFKKQGLATGDDVESILTRTETLLEEGDLDEAAREMNGLTGWARVLSQDWLTDCRRVLEVRQAVDVISTEAKLQSLLVT